MDRKQTSKGRSCARCGGALIAPARTYEGGWLCRACNAERTPEERGVAPMRKLYPTKRAYEAALAAAGGRKP